MKVDIDGGGVVFARALARQDDFLNQIRTVIEQTLRNALRRLNALDYYGSAYVNGIALPRTGDAATWRSAGPESDSFTYALRQSLGIELRAEHRRALIPDSMIIMPSSADRLRWAVFVKATGVSVVCCLHPHIGREFSPVMGRSIIVGAVTASHVKAATKVVTFQ